MDPITASTAEQYLAQPPGPCCFTGTIHEGTPVGTMEELIEVPTYVARPPSSQANGHVILYFPDVWGLSNNAMLLMDSFAASGYLTLGMDYFRGDPISKYRESKDDLPPPGFDQAAWRSKHFDFATENVPKWFEAARDRYGTSSTRYACVGFCFGAPFVCSLLAGDDVSAGAFAHPTMLKEEHFAKMNKPILLSCAEHDHAFPTDSRNTAIGILQRDGKKFHLQLFCGVSHGFAVKCDLADPYQRWCKEQSFQGMVSWFDMWLVRST